MAVLGAEGKVGHPAGPDGGDELSHADWPNGGDQLDDPDGLGAGEGPRRG
jgi:hypothetical protein